MGKAIFRGGGGGGAVGKAIFNALDVLVVDMCLKPLKGGWGL